jgi:hypothetical protein
MSEDLGSIHKIKKSRRQMPMWLANDPELENGSCMDKEKQTRSYYIGNINWDRHSRVPLGILCLTKQNKP